MYSEERGWRKYSTGKTKLGGITRIGASPANPSPESLHSKWGRIEDGCNVKALQVRTSAVTLVFAGDQDLLRAGFEGELEALGEAAHSLEQAATLIADDDDGRIGRPVEDGRERAR